MNAGATRVGRRDRAAVPRRGPARLLAPDRAPARPTASRLGRRRRSRRWPTTAPRAEEEWGLEDPRVTYVEELGRWIVAYTAFGRERPGRLAGQTDGLPDVRAARHRDVRPRTRTPSCSPRRVDGEWILFHRPTSAAGRRRLALALLGPRAGSSPEPVLRPPRRAAGGTRPASAWAPPPIETEHGWLVVYHGVRQTVAGRALPRRPGAARPRPPGEGASGARAEWVLGPRAATRSGDVPNVVFPCGLVHHEETDRLRLYYGAADTCIGLATANCATS